MKWLTSVGVLLLASTSGAVDYPEVTLEKLLTPDERVAIGLNKLNPAEQEKLRLCLIRVFIAGVTAGQQQAKQAVTAPVPDPPETDAVIESKIDGDFEGWQGETIVKLTNGQVWQQEEYWYHYHYSFMPAVLIFKSGSSYKMQVQGIDRPVRVTRLR